MSAAVEPVTKLPFRTAVEARDHAALMDAFAPDAVLRGPNTNRVAIEGREQIGALYRVIFEVVDDLRFTDELHSGESAVLVARGQVDGTDIEVVDHFRLDEDGRIRELTVFFRPLPAIAVANRAIGARLARRRSRIMGKIVSLLARPLVVQTRINDRFADRVVRRGLR